MTHPVVSLMTRPCVIRWIDQTGTDVHGDPITTTVETPAMCELQQSQSTELRDGQLVSVTAWNLYLPTDLDIPIGQSLDSADEIVVDGRTYTLDGDPWIVRDPTIEVDSHIEVKVRRVT